MQKILLNYKNLEVVADPVIKFLFNDDQLVGFVCQSGREVRTKELILTTGTFLKIYFINKFKQNKQIWQKHHQKTAKVQKHKKEVKEEKDV
jgi:tRNA U34 5-carboxymethylaminomethyl modifying enzyme MnmG/GidA